ncbi:hypothetical protein [Maridesulfovibrio sp.]|uniref:hypothetical protein n=1 Tax=Maridesulfovibrio sp. TaxID=2795000 RepID=UPI002AA84CA7|nr:hypothetical protein [Maridesulfovibrio sp.]
MGYGYPSFKQAFKSAGLGLMLALLAIAFAVQGCAFKKLADYPAEDQAVEYGNMLLSAYNATHYAYLEIKPDLTEKQRKKAIPFVEAMNVARPSILLVAKSAEAWKTGVDTQNATMETEARIKYRDQKVIAAEIWAEALELWNKIRRQE